MKLQEMTKEANRRGFTITNEMEKQFDQYMKLLIEWNQRMNLTAIEEPEQIVEKHFYDCLLPIFSGNIKGKILDVGSGAGFPGVVFAIALPDTQVTLLEPIQKRCRFLTAVKEELQLNNVEIVNARAEDYVKIHREIFDIVTARAVANLQILSELCIPFVKMGGNFISMKGTSGEEEYQKANHAITLLGCKEPEIQKEVLPDGSERIIFYFKKVKETPKQYPRPFGKIKKNPL